MKNQPRFTSGRSPLAVPLPFTVRKLLSFSMNRVLLAEEAERRVHVERSWTLAFTLARTPNFSSAFGRSWLSGTEPRTADRVLLELRQAEGADLVLVARRRRSR